MMFRLPRRLFLSLVAVWLVTPVAPTSRVQAQQPSTRHLLTVSTDRSEPLYRQGEQVTFTIGLQLDRQPVNDAEVQWTISKDGAPPIRTGTLKLIRGRGAVSGKLDEPGFLQCQAVFQTPAPTTLTAAAGAGVDPLQIQPSLPVPADFDAFWSAQKKKLAGVPASPRLTPVKSPLPDIQCFDVQADCVGAPVSGYFAKPVEAQPRSLPIILTVHGAGVRSSSLNGTADWAKRGFLALDINAHGIPNGQPDTFYTELANGRLKEYRTAGRDSRETMYFLGMFLRLVRAMDFLTAQPEWDGRTLVVYGSSQGGAQAIVAAGLDSRVTFIAASLPALCDHSGAVAGRISGWPKLVPNGPDGQPDARVLEAARYYDVVNFATRTRAAALVTAGFIDPTCPPTSVCAAFNALRGEKEIFNDPPSKHAVSAAAGQALHNAILRHVAARMHAQ